MTSLLDDKLDFNISNYNDFIDVSFFCQALKSNKTWHINFKTE